MKENHTDKKNKTEAQTPADAAPAQANKFKRGWHWIATHKKFSIPLAIIFVLILLAGIPHTRYGLAGIFVKQSFPLTVLDSETGKPVSGARVSLDGKEATTDNQGQANIHLPVGYAKLEVSKKYYNSSDRELVVPFRRPGKSLEIKLKATGRPVPVAVIHKISKKPLANVAITAEGTDAKTDQDGKATLVLPADKKEVKVKLSADGFNASEANLTVTSAEVPGNTFELTPAGKLYFLSNQSGKIDVVKTNLDGTDRKIVLAGTGKEDKSNTVLLASRDWKYLALLSKRDSDRPKLYLISTSDDSHVVMDEGLATFTLSGWSGHYFVYHVTRDTLPNSAAKRQALKTYNADAKKITTLDETQAEEPGPYSVFTEYIDKVYTFEDEIVFTKNFSGQGYNKPATVKHASINTVKPDGKNKKLLRAFSPSLENYYLNTSIDSYPYGTHEVYFRVSTESEKYYEYEDGKIEELKGFTNTSFYNGQGSYPTYLLSPSGEKTFWSEQRDGKNTINVGDKNGENSKPVAVLKNYQTYGWYTDDILLLSKEGSELYAMPTSGLKDEKKLVKITDYYKPALTYRGYGGGYGGL